MQLVGEILVSLLLLVVRSLVRSHTHICLPVALAHSLSLLSPALGSVDGRRPTVVVAIVAFAIAVVDYTDAHTH